MADLKVIRRQRKAALMRRFGGIERAMAEEDTDDLETKVVGLKMAFGEFERSHDAYHDTLMEELDLDQSDAWFTEVEQIYKGGKRG